MAWYNARGEELAATVPVKDESGNIVGWKFNPGADAEWREANGYIYDHNPLPPPPPPPPAPVDRTAFDAACEQFRAVCGQIAEAIGDPSFRGGFDEMYKLRESAIFGTIEGLQLADAWNGVNELCKYEGHKIGLEQPKWWYDCWAGIVIPAASDGIETEPTVEDAPPPMEEPLVYQEEIDAQEGEA